MSELAWRIENACIAAWPTRRECLIDGWLVRRSGGPVRRSNSANPTRDASWSEGVIARVEPLYRELGLDPLFRTPEIANGMDSALARRGYAIEGETLTLLGALEAAAADPRVQLAAEPSAAWVDAKSRFTPNFVPPAFLESVTAIGAPKRLASIAVDGEIVAEAYGVLTHDLLVIEAVATDPAHRQRGLAHACITTLMHWAEAAGAEATCLQVEATNASAVALYRKLGYGETVYRYHYRRAPRP